MRETNCDEQASQAINRFLVFMSKQKKADEQFCRFCGTTIKKEAEICPSCGVRPGTSVEEPASMTYCSACGDSIHSEAHRCPNCGKQAERIRKADWVDVREFSSSSLLTGLGSLFLLFSFVGLLNGAIGGFLLFGCFGALLLPQVRERISVDYPLITFGRKRRVDERLVETAEIPCSVCSGATKSGVERTYSEEFVLLGVSTITLEEGENYYCNDCLSTES